MHFQLASEIDVRSARTIFRRRGRVQLCPFLSEDTAIALASIVARQHDWQLVFNSRDKVYELDTAMQTSLTAEQRAALERGIVADAQHGFQYFYESIRVPDADTERVELASPLADFARFMSSSEVLELFRQVTDADDISFADAQATRFSAGHFLTAHDDQVAGKHRRLAYTFGLTEGWRTEWGGLLLFHDDHGDVTQGMLPRANVLSIFAVPQVHSVSTVGASAAMPRLSITGWLRAQR